MKLQFLGATRTVTGSRFLVDEGKGRILVDCGLYQGLKEYRLRNWAAFPVPTDTLQSILLTHAHIDHSGYLPRLVREGYRGPIFCTPATAALLEILLPDAAHLQEEEAEYANRQGFSKHHPALPLFTSEDARRALSQLKTVRYGKPCSVGPFQATFSPAGHLLGSATITVTGNSRKVHFSGDLGRYDSEVTRPPVDAGEVDAMVLESTYGARLHDTRSVEDELARVVNETYERNGVVLVPSFAVGRTQTVLYYLRKLEEQGRIPRRAVYVDSPMAVDATTIYIDHADDPNLKLRLSRDSSQCQLRCEETHFVRKAEESKSLNHLQGPHMIISAGGMATGGRVLHHLKRLLPGATNTVLLVGYQGVGTRGRSLLDGAREIKMHGQMVPVRARIENLDQISAHGDADDLIRWARSARRPPGTIFLVHGESAGQEALAQRLRKELPSTVKIPEYLEAFDV